MPKPAYRALQMISEQATADGAGAAVVTGGTQLFNVAGAVVGATSGAIDVIVSTHTVAGVPTALGVTALIANFNVSSAAAPPPTTVTITFMGPVGKTTTGWPSTVSYEVVDAMNTNPMQVRSLE